MKDWVVNGKNTQEKLCFLASMPHQNCADFMSYKLKFWLENTTELLEKQNCTSWLSNLEIDQVIDEEYLVSRAGTEKSTEVREWLGARESTNAIVKGGANPLKSSKDKLMQLAKDSENAAMRCDLVHIVSCTRDEILEQSWPDGHLLVNLKKRQSDRTFAELWRGLGSNNNKKDSCISVNIW